MADSADGTSFLSWKYGHYFSLVEISDKNVVVSCQLRAGVKNLSTSKSSNSNLMKHLLEKHTSTKLVAKDPSPMDAEGATPCKQPKLDFTQTAVLPISQAELNTLIARYLVDNMHPLSTA